MQSLHLVKFAKFFGLILSYIFIFPIQINYFNLSCDNKYLKSYVYTIELIELNKQNKESKKKVMKQGQTKNSHKYATFIWRSIRRKNRCSSSACICGISISIRKIFSPFSSNQCFSSLS